MCQSLRVSCLGGSNCDGDKEEKIENNNWYNVPKLEGNTAAQTELITQSLNASFAIKVKKREYVGVDK